MKFEIEIVVEEIIPAVRSALAQILSAQYGYTQEEIAEKLSVTQPAVSQYINETRASKELVAKIMEDPQIDILLEEASTKAAQEEDYSAEVSQIIQTVRDKGFLKEHFKDTTKL